ncbi:S-layer homology domain-containing protein [Aneurinibacillus tyrosinisolvens]|uniref:S-layer homology domain-containing protein n=1 Tax=Aneurinibacillus tyrosinisolvens TaxID=1443435 RepID=UPI00063F9144|nr:S-layer homology domain-containing protein [Aneurinibacillus tyrosinisolvens]
MKKLGVATTAVFLSLSLTAGPAAAAGLTDGLLNNLPIAGSVLNAGAQAAGAAQNSSAPDTSSLSGLGDALNGGSLLDASSLTGGNNVPGLSDLLNNLSPNPVIQGKNGLSMTTDRAIIFAGVPNFNTLKITVNYSAVEAGTLSVKIPAGAKVSSNGGGKESNGTLTWSVDPKTKSTGAFSYALTFDGTGTTGSSIMNNMTHTASLISNGNKQLATATAQTQVINPGSGVEERPRYVYGYTDKTFRPDSKLTRAEGVAVAVRIIFPGFDRKLPQKQLFKDVKPNYWAAQDITKAVAEGLISGNADGTFQPDKPMTRGEYMTLLAHALMKTPTSSASIPYPDVKGEELKNAVGLLQELNMLSGLPNGTLGVDLTLTRKEMVVMTNKVVLRLPLDNSGKATYKDVAPSAWYYGDVEAASAAKKYARNPLPGSLLGGVGTPLGQ